MGAQVCAALSCAPVAFGDSALSHDDHEQRHCIDGGEPEGGYLELPHPMYICYGKEEDYLDPEPEPGVLMRLVRWLLGNR